MSLEDLLQNTIVYDCEIKRCIPMKGKPNNPDLEYCEGWTDYIGMGISVVCVYSFSDEVMYTLIPDNPFDKAKLQALFKTTRCAIGFNNHHFDNKLLNAHRIPTPQTYDIFEEIKKVRGKYPKGYNLDAITKANFLAGKAESEGGSLAPILYQKWEMERLHKYCQQDVNMTVGVYKLVLENLLNDPVTGGRLTLAKPRQIAAYE